MGIRSWLKANWGKASDKTAYYVGEIFGYKILHKKMDYLLYTVTAAAVAFAVYAEGNVVRYKILDAPQRALVRLLKAEQVSKEEAAKQAKILEDAEEIIKLAKKNLEEGEYDKCMHNIIDAKGIIVKLSDDKQKVTLGNQILDIRKGLADGIKKLADEAAAAKKIADEEAAKKKGIKK